jgi:hypothetical protein
MKEVIEKNTHLHEELIMNEEIISEMEIKGN